MQAAMITGIRTLELREAPEVVLPGADSVLVRVDAVGVCGSDIHYYTQGGIGSQRLTFPQSVGHECAGTILEAGRAAKGLKAGQRVAIDPLIPCGRCDQCLSGRVNTCRNQQFLGCPGEAPGALREQLVLPARCCYPTPDSMSMAEAVMAEPLSIAIHAVRLAAGVRDGARVAVLGSGPIGLCVLLACRTEARCMIYATDLVNDRLAVARKCGAEWTGSPRESGVVEEILKHEPLGVDFAFECAGEQETLDQAVDLLKPGGTLVIAGIPEVERVSFPIHQLRRKEITLRNVRRQNECTADAVRWMAEGRVNVAPLITHHFPLAGSQAAFDLVAARRDGVVKAIIHVTEAV